MKGFKRGDEVEITEVSEGAQWVCAVGERARVLRGHKDEWHVRFKTPRAGNTDWFIFGDTGIKAKKVEPGVKIGDVVVLYGTNNYFTVMKDGDRGPVVEVCKDGQKVYVKIRNRDSGVWFNWAAGEGTMTKFRKFAPPKAVDTCTQKGIRLEVEKIEQNGEVEYRVLGVQALKKSQLPSEYVKTPGAVWLGEDTRVIWRTNSCLIAYVLVFTGHKFNYSKREMSLILSELRHAGELLMQVNKARKAEKSKKVTRETIVI